MLVATQSFAAYPDKPIRLVVPFAAGGGTDLIARTLGAGMSTELGQQIIVDNKPGAGTIIGTDAVAKSAPDGYNIVIATFAHAINPSLQPKLPYANDKAFTPITLIGKGRTCSSSAPTARSRPSRTSRAARAKPGKLTYASQGNGTRRIWPARCSTTSPRSR
jgi:tripartite-type tricarboxylate transporter receptor subunit TctC